MPYFRSRTVRWFYEVLRLARIPAFLLHPRCLRLGRIIARTRWRHAVLRRFHSIRAKKLKEIRVFDPTTHTRTACNVATHRCSVTNYHAPTSFTPRPVGDFGNGKRSLTRENLGLILWTVSASSALTRRLRSTGAWLGIATRWLPRESSRTPLIYK